MTQLSFSHVCELSPVQYVVPIQPLPDDVIAQRCRADGKDVILEIDWQGADQVREMLADAVSIFILPPSITELEKRLRGRGQDSADAIQTRLAEAKTDMAQAARYDYLLVNDDFERAQSELLSIIRSTRLRRERQLQGAEVTKLLQ